MLHSGASSERVCDIQIGSDEGNEGDGCTPVSLGSSTQKQGKKGHNAAPTKLPGPVTVTVAVRVPEDHEADSKKIRKRKEQFIAGDVRGIFHPDLYLAAQDCINYNGEYVGRSKFEKLGNSPMAKWYRSIRVIGPDGQLEPLGHWLLRHGLPLLRGAQRRPAGSTKGGRKGEGGAAAGGATGGKRRARGGSAGGGRGGGGAQGCSSSDDGDGDEGDEAEEEVDEEEFVAWTPRRAGGSARRGQGQQGQGQGTAAASAGAADCMTFQPGLGSGLGAVAVSGAGLGFGFGFGPGAGGASGEEPLHGMLPWAVNGWDVDCDGAGALPLDGGAGGHPASGDPFLGFRPGGCPVAVGSAARDWLPGCGEGAAGDISGAALAAFGSPNGAAAAAAAGGDADVEADRDPVLAMWDLFRGAGPEPADPPVGLPRAGLPGAEAAAHSCSTEPLPLEPPQLLRGAWSEPVPLEPAPHAGGPAAVPPLQSHPQAPLQLPLSAQPASGGSSSGLSISQRWAALEAGVAPARHRSMPSWHSGAGGPLGPPQPHPAGCEAADAGEPGLRAGGQELGGAAVGLLPGSLSVPLGVASLPSSWHHHQPLPLALASPFAIACNGPSSRDSMTQMAAPLTALPSGPAGGGGSCSGGVVDSAFHVAAGVYGRGSGPDPGPGPGSGSGSGPGADGAAGPSSLRGTSTGAGAGGGGGVGAVPPLPLLIRPSQSASTSSPRPNSSAGPPPLALPPPLPGPGPGPGHGAGSGTASDGSRPTPAAAAAGGTDGGGYTGTDGGGGGGGGGAHPVRSMVPMLGRCWSNLEMYDATSSPCEARVAVQQYQATPLQRRPPTPPGGEAGLCASAHGQAERVDWGDAPPATAAHSEDSGGHCWAGGRPPGGLSSSASCGALPLMACLPAPTGPPAGAPPGQPGRPSASPPTPYSAPPHLGATPPSAFRSHADLGGPPPPHSADAATASAGDSLSPVRLRYRPGPGPGPAGLRAPLEGTSADSGCGAGYGPHGPGPSPGPVRRLYYRSHPRYYSPYQPPYLPYHPPYRHRHAPPHPYAPAPRAPARRMLPLPLPLSPDGVAPPPAGAYGPLLLPGHAGARGPPPRHGHGHGGPPLRALQVGVSGAGPRPGQCEELDPIDPDMDFELGGGGGGGGGGVPHGAGHHSGGRGPGTGPAAAAAAAGQAQAQGQGHLPSLMSEGDDAEMAAEVSFTSPEYDYDQYDPQQQHHHQQRRQQLYGSRDPSSHRMGPPSWGGFRRPYHPQAAHQQPHQHQHPAWPGPGYGRGGGSGGGGGGGGSGGGAAGSSAPRSAPAGLAGAAAMVYAADPGPGPGTGAGPGPGMRGLAPPQPQPQPLPWCPLWPGPGPGGGASAHPSMPTIREAPPEGELAAPLDAD